MQLYTVYVTVGTQGHVACDGCGRDLLTAEDFLEYYVSDVPEDLQTQIEGKDCTLG